MRRSGFKQKPRKPLKHTPLKKKSRIKYRGTSDTSVIKEKIQSTLREICLLRDKKCILWGVKCNHEVGMEGLVWQAEHLVERSNSVSYADSRLVVLVERSCHGWKHFTKSNHDQYDEWVRQKLSPERVRLWDAVRADQRAHRTHKVDWKLELLALQKELSALTKQV